MRHRQPGAAQRANGAERDQVAGGDDSVEWDVTAQQPGDRGFGRFELELDLGG